MDGRELVQFYFDGLSRTGSTLWWMGGEFEYDDNPLLWDCLIVVRHAMDSVPGQDRLAQMIDVMIEGLQLEPWVYSEYTWDYARVFNRVRDRRDSTVFACACLIEFSPLDKLPVYEKDRLIEEATGRKIKPDYSGWEIV